MTRINHNMSAYLAVDQLSRNNRGLAKSLERLSTGLRINHASDDVAGIAVSEKMRTQVRGTSMAKRNANDGIAMLQIAEGALSEMTHVLQRMRELAVQSATDTNGTTERAYLNREFQSLMAEVDRIAMGSQYNGITLLDGGSTSFGTLGGSASVLHIGANYATGASGSAIDSLAVHITSATLGALGLSLNTVAVSTGVAALQALNMLDSAINSINSVRSELGATVNRLESALESLQIQEVNMTSAESTIRDTDFAAEMTEMTRNQILVQSATAMLSQANQAPQSILALLQG
jgi:flagellin